MTESPPSLSRAQVWWLAARPKTLWAAFAPILIAGALALGDGMFHAPSLWAALVAAMLIQVGTNFCNDYADFKKGADTHERVGPLRVTQAGLVSPRAMGWATALVFSGAALVCLYLIARGGWPMVWIAVSSILSGIWYTAGRYPMGYLGLGDVFVLIFFGPVAVGGTYYVQALDCPSYVLVAGLAAGLLSCAILAVNNLRDIEQDRPVGKRTLAVRFGPGFARTEYMACLVGGLVIVPLYLALMVRQQPVLLVACFAWIPAMAPIKHILGGTKGPALNPVLGQTARVLLIFSILFSIGWLMASGVL
jgi:1,4-dihydroxy-2-naphthoate polyprenyltransferase